MIGAVAFLLAATPLPLEPARLDSTQVSGLAGELVQITVQQIIIRVPRRDPRVAAMSHAGWRETGGPRCIPARMIAGAMPSPRTVDLLMRDNSRVRARLGQRCAALDYYRGLYVDANADGRLCAGRDVIRSRMGGQCEIVEFRALRPAVQAR